MTDRRVRSELMKECALAIEQLIDIFVQFETRFHFFTTTFMHQTIITLRDTLVTICDTLQWKHNQIPPREAELHAFFLLILNDILTINATFPRISPAEKTRIIRQIKRQCRTLHYLLRNCYH